MQRDSFERRVKYAQRDTFARKKKNIYIKNKKKLIKKLNKKKLLTEGES